MARHMRNGRDYSRPGPKVDYELRKDSNNAARSGEVYDKIEEIQSQIVPTASIENGETASKAYLKGDFLVKDGTLYKVTKAIAKNDALTVGTNIAMTTVGSELSEIKPSLSQKYSFDNSYYLAGTTASANVTLNKTLSEINTFLVVFMGSGYVTRATNTVPACLLIQYPSVTHQFNIYLGGRSYVQMNRVDDTHVRIENNLDGTYCDRVYLLWA